MIDLNEAQFREAIEAMYFAYREFTTKPDEILDKRGLNRVHHRILYFVGKNPQISVGSLTGLLKVSKQAMNTPLRQLIGLGLVDNQVDTEDRRSRRLSLTSEGMKLEQELTQAQVKLLQKVFGEQSENSVTQWISVMRAISKQDSISSKVKDVSCC